MKTDWRMPHKFSPDHKKDKLCKCGLPKNISFIHLGVNGQTTYVRNEYYKKVIPIKNRIRVALRALLFGEVLLRWFVPVTQKNKSFILEGQKEEI